MMNFVAFQPCRPRRDDEKRGGEGREEMDFGERILACSPRLGQFRGRLERKIVEKFDYERIYSVSFLILISRVGKMLYVLPYVSNDLGRVDNNFNILQREKKCVVRSRKISCGGFLANFR